MVMKGIGFNCHVDILWTQRQWSLGYTHVYTKKEPGLWLFVIFQIIDNNILHDLHDINNEDTEEIAVTSAKRRSWHSNYIYMD